MSTLAMTKPETKKESIFQKINVQTFSLTIISILFILLFSVGSYKYHSSNFFSPATIINLFNSNAHMLVSSIGITFVLITGGIDNSVGSVIAFTAVFSASVLNAGLPAAVAIILALLLGSLFGAFQGFLIQYFKMQPFIVTLAGQFLLRGLCSVITNESITINNASFKKLAQTRIKFKLNSNVVSIYSYVFIAILIIIIAFIVLKYTKFGRNVYAVGGNEQSAMLMGLPVNKIKVSVYAISAFCASVGGIIFSFGTLAGNPRQNIGDELDAISSAVIGGTPLSGGIGSPIGSVLGTLTQGLIKNIVTYEGLSAWWSKVVNAALLCLFIIIQRVISKRIEEAKNKNL